MSGIAGLAGARHASEDRDLIASMGERLAVRGRDARGTWCDGRFGLAHALLRTTDESKEEKQPLTVDAAAWIAADARIDARRDLVGRLRDAGREARLSDPDAALILHAYHAWGTDCPRHLLGDFAFIIADPPRGRLFCARDHLGVKPLFFASGTDWLVVSNTLDCVRLHSQVSSRLDDSFVCDFLLFGWNTDVTASVFADIRRLAPAHGLEWTDGRLVIRRYWSMTIPDEVRGRSLRDQVDGFREVFETAVEDRLRTDRVVVFMSGGLDSSSLAATALPLLKKRSSQAELRAVTGGYDRIIPDRERHYASEVADCLGIPIDFVVGDDLEFFSASWDSPATQTPEPSERGNLMGSLLHVKACGHSPVVLSGEGGDEAIKPPRNYYRALLRERRFGRWWLDCWRHVWTLRTLPPMGVRTLLYKRALRRLRGIEEPTPQFPDWIHPDLVTRFELRDRWNWFWNMSHADDSRVPGGHWAVTSCLTPTVLDAYSVAETQPPSEYRFPFLDLRVLAYCWSLPPIPMRFGKHLLRVAWEGRLPRTVVRRPKEGLAGDPLLAKEVQFPVSWEQYAQRTPELALYVVAPPAWEQARRAGNPYTIPMNCRPFELASWLHHRRPINQSLSAPWRCRFSRPSHGPV
jgi:asparagine synthase (glutamine-hydrolysing)